MSEPKSFQLHMQQLDSITREEYDHAQRVRHLPTSDDDSSRPSTSLPPATLSELEYTQFSIQQLESNTTEEDDQIQQATPTPSMSESKMFQISIQKLDSSTSMEGSQVSKVTPILVQSAPSTPPDGGFEAWLKVAGSSLLLVNMTGWWNCFGIFQAYYATTLLPTSTLAQLSLIGAIQGCLLGMGGALVGPVFDRGYHHLLVYGSCIIMLFGIMMLSLCKEYYQILLAQGVCLGIAGGMIYSPSLAIASSSFTSRRSTALMCVNIGTNIGGIIYAEMFRSLIPRIGFGWTIRAMGLVALVINIIACICLRPKRVPSKKPRTLIELHAFKEAPYTIFCIGGFLKYIAMYIPYAYIPVYAEVVLHASQQSAFLLQIYLNLGAIIGRIAFSQLADNFSLLFSWTLTAFATTILCFTWLAVTSLPTLITWVFLFGIFSGPLFSLPLAVVPFISLPQVIGTRLGMTAAFGGAGLLLGNPLGGALVNVMTRNFQGLILFCGSVMFVGASMQLPLWWLIRQRLAAKGGKMARLERWVLVGMKKEEQGTIVV